MRGRMRNRVKAVTNAAGVGNVTPGAAVNAAYRDFSGCTTNEFYYYLIEQNLDWEEGCAQWNGTALIRLGPGASADPTFDSSTGNLLSVVANSLISITDAAETFPVGYDMKSALSILLQQTGNTFTGTADSDVSAKIDRGGLVGMAMIASTNVSFGAGGRTSAIAQYTVPAGCVVIMVDTWMSEAVRNNGSFYGMTLYNVTQGFRIWGGVAGTSAYQEQPISGIGMSFAPGAGGSFSFTWPAKVAVAGDVIKIIAYNPSGDSNRRTNSSGYIFAVCDSTTLKMLPVR